MAKKLEEWSQDVIGYGTIFILALIYLSGVSDRLLLYKNGLVTLENIDDRDKSGISCSNCPDDHALPI